MKDINNLGLCLGVEGAPARECMLTFHQCKWFCAGWLQQPVALSVWEQISGCTDDYLSLGCKVTATGWAQISLSPLSLSLVCPPTVRRCFESASRKICISLVLDTHIHTLTPSLPLSLSCTSKHTYTHSKVSKTTRGSINAEKRKNSLVGPSRHTNGFPIKSSVALPVIHKCALILRHHLPP